MSYSQTLSDEPADRDLEFRVKVFLAGQDVPGLRGLEIEARGGLLTIRGRVRSFYEKRLIYSAARRVAGVIGLVDLIHVAESVPGSEHRRRFAFSPDLRRYLDERQPANRALPA